MIALYFSGTGNSAYIAKGFAQRMGAVCHSIEEDVDFAALMSAHGTVAVCYPIYGSCVPRIMREFAAKHSAILAEKKLIILCTQMMFSGDGAQAFARLLPGCDSSVLYAEHFSMPNNISNFWLFPVREGERRRKQRAAARKLERVCRDIQSGIVRRRGWSRFSVLLGKLQNSYWMEIEGKQKGSFTADGDCNHCGLCVRRCPVQNLALGEGGVTQKNNCILCYRCVNLCPQRAATVMLHAKPKRQYKGIELSGNENRPWNQTATSKSPPKRPKP